ncbi:MAG: AMP-binding protein [Clostridia bacterium]|nr:AMP-binding protein [Clostridia bacterium]
MGKDYPYNKVKHVRDIKEMMEYIGEKYAKETAFWYTIGGKQISVNYEQVKKDVFALASYFYSIDVKNAKIALYSENSYEWIVTYLAAVIGSNIIVPLDKELKPAEAATLYRACDADMLVYSEKKSALTEEFAEGELKHSLCLSNFADAAAKGEAMLCQTGILENEIDVEAPCSIIYTSGTTGTPKGVMLCQRNLISDMIRSLETLRIPKGTVAVLPFNHTFGFMACVLCQMHIGSPVYINAGLKYVLHDINIAKPSHISVVPLFIDSFYKGIWKNAKKSGKDKALKALIKTSNAMRKVGIDMRKKLFKSVIDAFGGNLEMIITGGAPISNEMIKAFDDLGIKIINGYGISECSPIVSINRDKWIKLGSVGQHINTVQVKTINNNEDGEGEICVKGDIVMLGYYNNPEANADVFFEDGWFKTGDIGKVDEDGFVYITGRKKNLIILENGKNVYPEELEYLIGNIDGVDEVLVYAEDGYITAEIYAEDMTKKDAITESIKTTLNSSVAAYKQIRKIKFRASEFEKTTTKKIKR